MAQGQGILTPHALISKYVIFCLEQYSLFSLYLATAGINLVLLFSYYFGTKHIDCSQTKYLGKKFGLPKRIKKYLFIYPYSIFYQIKTLWDFCQILKMILIPGPMLSISLNIIQQILHFSSKSFYPQLQRWRRGCAERKTRPLENAKKVSLRYLWSLSDCACSFKPTTATCEMRIGRGRECPARLECSGGDTRQSVLLETESGWAQLKGADRYYSAFQLQPTKSVSSRTVLHWTSTALKEPISPVKHRGLLSLHIKGIRQY